MQSVSLDNPQQIRQQALSGGIKYSEKINGNGRDTEMGQLGFEAEGR
jgi:hypothetical protein